MAKRTDAEKLATVLKTLFAEPPPSEREIMRLVAEGRELRKKLEAAKNTFAPDMHWFFYH